MSNSKLETLNLGLLVVALAVSAMNTFAIFSIQNQTVTASTFTGAAVVSTSQDDSQGAVSNAIPPEIQLQVLPAGVPAVYGAELGVRFDAVSTQNPSLADATIKTLAQLDKSITLSGESLNRYITITNQISCEYCCGAPAITTRDGKAACGCAHSYAMRGLAKYLISQHGEEYSDDQILEELGKWKALFFPDAAALKAQALAAKGYEFNYINLASNKYRGLEKQASGSNMVGGC